MRHLANGPSQQPTRRQLLAWAQSLCVRIHATRPLPYRLWRLVRWYLLLATHPRLGMAWVKALWQPEMRDYVEAHPQLLLKPLRPYLSLRWGVERRCTIIRDTHRLAVAHPQLRRALLSSSGVRLLHGALPGDKTLEVRMVRDQKFRKEGELVLALHDSWPGQSLFSLSLAFECPTGQPPRCYVGSIQGREHAAAGIKAMTKACHGMRPPALLLHIARQLVRQVGATSLLCAGNSIHVHRRKHLIHIPWLHQLSYDYDQVWQELGGNLESDGWYRLPLESPRRERDDIPVRKRAQYERRYEWLDRIDAEIARTLNDSAGS
jgi:hypothetical protein